MTDLWPHLFRRTDLYFVLLGEGIVPVRQLSAPGDADALYQRVERRREEQPEAGDPEHAAEDGGATPSGSKASSPHLSITARRSDDLMDAAQDRRRWRKIDVILSRHDLRERDHRR